MWIFAIVVDFDVNFPFCAFFYIVFSCLTIWLLPHANNPGFNHGMITCPLVCENTTARTTAPTSIIKCRIAAQSSTVRPWT